MKWLTSIALCFTAIACNSSPSVSNEPPKPPVRVAVEVTDDGYKPARIDVERNQPLTMVVTRTSTSTCGEQLVVPSKNIKVDLPLNTPVEVFLTAQESGTIGFACGMDMYKGAIVVK